MTTNDHAEKQSLENQALTSGGTIAGGSEHITADEAGKPGQSYLRIPNVGRVTMRDGTRVYQATAPLPDWPQGEIIRRQAALGNAVGLAIREAWESESVNYPLFVLTWTECVPMEQGVSRAFVTPMNNLVAIEPWPGEYPTPPAEGG